MATYPWTVNGFDSKKLDGGDLTQEALAERKLSVDVFHLNIGVGDCTIYLLVEYPDEVAKLAHPTWKNPYIHRAVLIDGGFRPPEGEVHPAKAFMTKTAPVKYAFPTTQGGRAMKSPAFDAMVITHWDSDHYEGVLWLLVEDLYARNPTKSNARTNYLLTYKNPLLKYYDTHDHANRAKSFLYVPYWNKLGVAKFPSKGSSRKDRVFYKDDKDNILFHANRSSWSNFTKTDQWTEGMCRLRYDHKKMLAVNLFTNVTPQTCDFASPQALALEHTMHGNIKKANPCLVIVSVNNVCTGSSMVAEDVWPSRFDQIYNSKWFKNQDKDKETWSELNPDFTQQWPRCTIPENLDPADQVDQVVQSVDSSNFTQSDDNIGVNMIDDPLPLKDEAKITNAYSIITMVVWGDGHISHYAAGDANWENELKVVWWVWNSNNPYKTVRAVKLSHHGSSDSTPIELIRGFRPHSIIVSAFDEYGHPRWEVLLWLYYWRQTTNDYRYIFHQAKRSYGLLYPTCYPYYLAYQTLSNNKRREAWLSSYISVKAFSATEKSKQNQKYRKSLKAMMAKVAGGDDIIAEFQRLEASLGDGKKKPHQSYLYGKTRDAFHAMSDLRDAAAPHATRVTDGYGLIMSDQEQIQFVRVCCRSWDLARIKEAGNFFDGDAQPTTFTLTVEQAAKRKADNEKKSQRIAKTRTEVQLEEIARRFELAAQAVLANFMLEDDRGTRLSKLKPFQEKRNKLHGMYENIRPKEWPSLLDKRVARKGYEYDDCGLGEALFKKQRLSKDNYGKLQAGLPTGNVLIFIKAATYSPNGTAFETFENLDSASRLGISSTDSGGVQHSVAVNGGAVSTSTFDKDATDILASLGISEVKAAAILITPENGTQTISIVYDAGACVKESPGRILPSTPFDDFLISIRSSQIHFNAQGPSISKHDNLFKYFQETLHAFEVNLDFDLSDTNTATFKSMSIKITEPMAIEYSSQNLLAAAVPDGNFGTANYPGFQMSGPAYFFADDTILLGLTAKSKELPWSMKNLLVALDLMREGTANLLQSLLECMDESANGGHFKLAAGALWFTPGQSYILRKRLEWHLSDSNVVAVQNFVHRFLPKMTITAPKIVGKREIRNFDSLRRRDYILSSEISLVLGAKYNDTISLGAIIDVKYDGEGGSMTLTISPPDVSIKEIIVWVIGLFHSEKSNLSDSDTSSILDFVNAIPVIDAVILRRLEISISDLNIERLTLYFEINPGWKDKNGNAIPFLVTYTYTPDLPQPHGMTAQAWLAVTGLQESTIPSPFFYDYDDFRVLKPSVHVSDHLYLTSIMPGDWVKSLPKGLDLAIIDARIVLHGKKVSLFGRLMSHLKDEKEREENTKSLGLSLKQVTLAASFEWGDTSSYSVELGVSLDMTPFYGDDVEVDPVTLRGAIQYQSLNNQRFFSLTASIQDLTFASILNFFPLDDAAVIADTLGNFSIRCLDIEYTFDGSGMGSNFTIIAIILLGPVELDLKFQRSQLKWEFNATLRENSQLNTTIEHFLRDLLGDSDLINAIPDFIKGTDLSDTHGGSSDGGPDDRFKPQISLSLESKEVAVDPDDKSAQSIKNDFFITSLSLALPFGQDSGIEFSYLQVSNKPTRKAANKPDTKRVIRATIGNLPWDLIPRVPLVERVDPPFDELDFLWVGSDLNRSDLSVIGKTGGLRYKDIAPTKKTTDVLLQAGWHFILTPASFGAVAILDYTFNKPKTKSLPAPGQPGDPSRPNPSPLPNPTGEAAESGGTQMAPMQKTVGPLKISNIGARFENGEIVFYLDATVKLGPIGFLLKGFGMGLQTRGKFSEIFDTPPSLHIQGIGVQFDSPSVTLTGMFLNQSVGPDIIYMGGLTLGMPPYSLMAVGSYTEVAAKNDEPPYKSVFVYARLDGPLVELGWMTISNVMVGFGYNSIIRQPLVSEVSNFPFLSHPAAVDESPLDAMTRFSSGDPSTAWIRPQNGSLWVAAGAKIKAFQMLEAEAVLMVQCGTSVSVDITAIGSAQMPPKVKRDQTFLYIELGITASFDPKNGALRVEGQLTPNSFVIHPSCHLTGGFALCSWFDNSPYCGDFVFSIGGYHPAYKPPIHYPVPQRLSISWDVGGGLMITGNAYFAVTPTCCMGGGMLKAVLSLGHLYAYFTVYADFLINFAPFYFQGQLGISVGVRYVQSLWFTTITISADIGADLYLRGPPFGGTAHVNLWVFGFDVNFGDQSSQVAALSFKKFRALILNLSEEKVIDYHGDEDPARPLVDDAHTLTIEVGRRVLPNAKAATEKAGDTWHVNLGGFRFRVESKIPIQTMNSQNFGQTQAFFAEPMQRADQLRSTMTVKVESIEHSEISMHLDPITKRMPTSLWGKYDADSDPSRTSDPNKLNGLLSPTPGTDVMNCLIGSTFSNPLAESPPEAIQPFDPRICMKQSIFAADDHIVPVVPANIVMQHPGWLAAQPQQVPDDNPALLWQILRDSWKKPKLTSILIPPMIPLEPLMPPVTAPMISIVTTTANVAIEGTQEQVAIDTEDVASPNRQQLQITEEQERQVHEELTKSIIDVWSDAFSWDTPSMGTSTHDPGLKLKSDRPTLLWERFEQLYMSAPMVAQDVFT